MTASGPPAKLHAPHRRATGFTLVEMVVALTLIGLLAVAVVPLLRLPMQSYLDAVRRAEVTGELDGVVSKLRDDLSQALPGSLRVDATGTTLEYLRVRAMGRYRSAAAASAVCTGAPANDVLAFGTPDTRFATLGLMTGLAPGSDHVVVSPLSGNVYAGGPGANPLRARLLGSTPSATAPTSASCLQVASNTFGTPAAGKMFYVVAEPVSYACNPAAATLTRYWGYAIAAVQPVAFAAGVASAPLARRVAGCRFAVSAAGPSGQVVSMWLQLNTPSTDVGATEPAQTQLTLAVREAP